MEKNRQPRRITIKIIILVAIVVASTVLMGVFISSMQTRMYLDNYTAEMESVLADLPDQIERAEEETALNYEAYDNKFQGLADGVSYLARKDAKYRNSNAMMGEYKHLLEVDNILLVNQDGTILNKAAHTPADFSSSRFNQLRSVFIDFQPSDPVSVNLPDEGWNLRYYAARVNSDQMIIIEQDPNDLDELVEESGSMESVLRNISLAQTGFVFAVSELDYTVEYYPDSDLIGTDALYDGIDVGDLEDGAFSWMYINDQELYCEVKLIDNTYYIAAVPESDMSASGIVAVAVIMFTFAVVMVVLLLYGIFIMRENERKGTDPENVRQIGRLYINKSIARRSAILSLVGIIAVFGITFYMETLFALSSKSVSEKAHVESLVDNMDISEARIESLSETYGSGYLPLCSLLGYILDEEPDLINHDDLVELGDILNVENIYIYGKDGKIIATDSAYTNYDFYDDPDNPYQDFIQLLQGDVDYVILPPAVDDISGYILQYIGVPIHDENGYVDGIAQIAIRPTILEIITDISDIGTVLGGMNDGTDDFAFAINKEDDTFAFLPINEDAVGDSVYDHDMTWEQIAGGYNDYLTIDGTKYYASSVETEDYYIYVAGTEIDLMSMRLPPTLMVFLFAIICIFVIYILSIFEPAANIRPVEGDPNSDDRFIEREMPGGRTIRTESIVSRFMGTTRAWEDKNPWQKTLTVLKWIMIGLVAVICIAVIFHNRIFANNPVFAYILGNDWERGFNIFGITACIMFSCVAIVVAMLAQRLIQLLTGVLSAKGETVCRLLKSFIRYGTLIGMIFFCLALLGVNVVTLLVSAGILTLAISLGAQSLVQDIISGLFIIFEGDFRVGDIVTVGDWRGTVLEIGIRTTKIEDPSQNVKVIRNSDLNNVINMTKKLSFVSCDFAIEYNESLEHVESILAKELPAIADRLPAIVNGPFYRGVTALSDSSVDLRVSMQCEEKDRMQLERDFNREMKLIFDKYDINIPFPQVVINEPTVQKTASSYEKWLAQQFTEEQKVASQEMGGDTGQGGNS